MFLEIVGTYEIYVKTTISILDEMERVVEIVKDKELRINSLAGPFNLRFHNEIEFDYLFRGKI